MLSPLTPAAPVDKIWIASPIFYKKMGNFITMTFGTIIPKVMVMKRYQEQRR
ncbi:hypothetical protein SAMN05444410_10840 [Hydrobacter penzbergensis]|uniref:Uncharacterized protein n=1 Tax=Hydrobacter penzbergensis TaxID=1235997 RepID=A0A8X8IFJ9_9BACT|nr:hypothetical protein SAMN05444410_10840 [Hydrobacter penzbergensis]